LLPFAFFAFLAFFPGDILIETTFFSFFAAFFVSFFSFLGDFAFFAGGCGKIEFSVSMIVAGFPLGGFLKEVSGYMVPKALHQAGFEDVSP
jgi:hypothetical protein